MSYLTEAFKQMELLESEQFTFDKDGAAKLSNFLDDDMLNDFEAIIDPEAEEKEDIKDSYMGDVICRCCICKSLIYKDPEDINIDEEAQLANIDEECPFCFETGGYEIVGQVAPYEEISVEGADEGTKVEVDGQEVEATTTNNDNESDKDDDNEEDEVLEESLSNLDKLYKAYPELKDTSSMGMGRDRARRHTRDNEDIEDCQRFPVEGTKQVDLKEDLDEESNEDDNIEDNVKILGAKTKRHVKDNEDLEDSQRFPIESPAPAQTGLREGKKRFKAEEKDESKETPLNENMEDISITTDDQVIKVKATPRTDKEVIQPVEKETKDMIETPDEEEIPMEDEEVVDLEEIDEESLDTLGESYLKNVYENVNSFKTSSVKNLHNQMIVEGIISFNSGKKCKTQFIFEAKEATKSGKLKFSGLNENITKNKKAFTLTGSIKDNKLMLESLNYNYSAKTEDGKSKRLYGTVRI